LLIDIARIRKVNESKQTTRSRSDLPDSRAGVFAGTKGPPRIGWLGFQVDSFRDQVEPQFGPSHEATIAAVHTQGSPAQNSQVP
jgi:hypothetical protein